MKCGTMATKIKVAFIVLALLLLMTPEPSLAIQSSQQYAKLFYSPYYVASLSQNVNTTFAFTISPPDGFSGTQSAVLNFQVYAIPSVTFTLYVDGKACSPASFYINTQYAGASLLPFSFDCSGVVNHKGTYTAKLSPSKDTGAGYGWLDVTYTNKPAPELSIFGTEYQPGDLATPFLRLLDADLNPVNNALCTLDIYAPYSYNITHPELVNNQLMLFKEEGLYYYDYLLPSYAGVYMLLADCRYAQTLKEYPDGELVRYPNVTAAVGTILGSPLALNSFTDGVYVQGEASAGKIMDLNFTFTDLSLNYTNASRVDANVWFETPVTGDPYTFQIWNWTKGAWHVLGTYAGKGIVPTPPPIDVNEYVSYQVPNDTANFFKNNSAILRVNLTSAKSSVDTFFNAVYFMASTYDLSAVPPELRGSGEIHVSSLNVTSAVNLTPVLSSIYMANQSVHSSLASNFTQVLGNESLIRSDISSVNSTMLSQFSSLTSYLGTQFGYVLGNLTSYFSALNGNLIGNFTEKDLAIESVNRTLHDALSSNFSYTDGLVSGVGASVISTNDTLHDSISGLGLEIYDVGLDVLSTNATLHSSISSAESNILGEESSTQYSVWFANGTLHDSLFGNFTYTNAFINDTNTSVYNELISLNITGSFNGSFGNVTLPTGFFTKMSNLAAGFWILVVVAILGALWWFFR